LIDVGTLGALELEDIATELFTDALELTTVALELIATELGLGAGLELPPPPHATNSELKVIRLKYCKVDCLNINVLM